MRKLLFIFLFVFLPACNFLPPPQAGPSETIVFKPSATPTIVPLPTSTEMLQLQLFPLVPPPIQIFIGMILTEHSLPHGLGFVKIQKIGV